MAKYLNVHVYTQCKTVNVQLRWKALHSWFGWLLLLFLLFFVSKLFVWVKSVYLYIWEFCVWCASPYLAWQYTECIRSLRTNIFRWVKTKTFGIKAYIYIFWCMNKDYTCICLMFFVCIYKVFFGCMRDFFLFIFPLGFFEGYKSVAFFVSG